MILSLCLAVALHDVDGPVYCADGVELRIAGIGATELDGTCRPHQPCIPGDPFRQRRRMATLLGARVARETRAPSGGRLVFAAPVALRYRSVGHSHARTVAWVTLPDGRDAGCAAIAAHLAKRWPIFDRADRLTGCGR